MRHVVILAGISLFMAILTGYAYQFDLSKKAAKQQTIEAQISKEIEKLELKYIKDAVMLISSMNADDPLVVELRSIQSSIIKPVPLSERDILFQEIVLKTRAKLISGLEAANNKIVAQEWQKITDQLNGSLHCVFL